jgi:hypothetical protein
MNCKYIFPEFFLDIFFFENRVCLIKFWIKELYTTDLSISMDTATFQHMWWEWQIVYEKQDIYILISSRKNRFLAVK